MKDQEEALHYLYNAWDCTNAVPFDRVRAAARCLKILATSSISNKAVASSLASYWIVAPICQT